MKKVIKKLTDNILAVVVGSMLISIVLIFFQSPPTRAEFGALKYKQEIQYKHVCELFKEIKDDIKEIKGMLYARKTIRSKKRYKK